MMSKEKWRVPKLRFPGFTEDWEQRKLNEFLSVSNLKNTENKYNKKNVLSVSGDYGIVNQIEFQGRSFAGASVSNYGVVEKGDIVYTKSPLKLNPYGIIKTNRINNGIVSTLYAIYKTKENCDSKFIEHYFNLDSRLNQYLKPLVNKGAKNDMKVSSENALVGEICFPQITEQAMIADLLDRLDIYITLHQHKLDNLKLKKKALLQKLFPKNGERYPELRFPGFTDAWEQRKLDDIAKIKTGGGTPKTANPEYWSGNIPWIQSSDLVEGDIVHVNINKFINNNALKNSAAKLISRDSIVLVTRVGVGKVAVINQEFTTSQDFLSLSDFDGSDIKFLAYQLYRLMQENAKVLQGTSIKGITKTELIEQSISIPSSGQEQNLISNVLSKIDSIITLHQRKLDHLQLQKKALLQQMFV